MEGVMAQRGLNVLDLQWAGLWCSRWNLIREIVEYTGSISHHRSPRAIRKSTMVDCVILLGIPRQLMRRMAMQERMEHRRVVKSWKFERRQS
jgi:hypothetical protein